MTSIFVNRALFLLIGSGSWGRIVFVIVLLLCCGMMPFEMRGMGKGSKRINKTQEDFDEKHDDDQPKQLTEGEKENEATIENSSSDNSRQPDDRSYRLGAATQH